MPATAMMFISGAFIGSFLNVCALRIPQKKTFVNDRSACPRCGHMLGAMDLIPILSFAGLRGRCRYCRENISSRYLLTELLTGGIFASIYSVYGFQPVTLVYLLLASTLMIIALIDFSHLYIPNQLVVFGLVSGSLLHILLKTGGLKFLVLGLIAGGFPLLAVYVISRGGMGAGDVKLGAMMGIFLGWKLALAALFFGFLTGAIIGVLLLAAGIKGRKDAIPFGPFLAFGGVAASLWGGSLINWYLATMWP